MKLVIGLGNPGTAYRHTRHNAGRRLVERIAKAHAVRFEKKSRLKASVVSLNWDNRPVVLAYPETFMNVSGEAVNLLVHYFSIDFKTDLLIVVDDLALPLSRLRLRGQGSDGGHNGLKSVQQFLGSPDFARLRLGIGSSESVPAEEYVLSAFDPEEEKSFEAVLEKGAEACRMWATQPFQKVMTSVNTSQD